jgi:hypothetical protein
MTSDFSAKEYVSRRAGCQLYYIFEGRCTEMGCICQAYYTILQSAAGDVAGKPGILNFGSRGYQD